MLYTANSGNKQNAYLPVPLTILLLCNNSSPPLILAVPLPRPATQVELVLRAAFVVTNTGASGGIFGTLPGPRAAAECQPAEAEPDSDHKTVTDPSAATRDKQTAGRRFLGITSPKTTAQSSEPAADGQLSCSAWQHLAKHLYYRVVDQKMSAWDICNESIIIVHSSRQARKSANSYLKKKC